MSTLRAQDAPHTNCRPPHPQFCHCHLRGCQREWRTHPADELKLEINRIIVWVMNSIRVLSRETVFLEYQFCLQIIDISNLSLWECFIKQTPILYSVPTECNLSNFLLSNTPVK